MYIRESHWSESTKKVYDMIMLAFIPKQWNMNQQYIHGCTCAALATSSRRYKREPGVDRLRNGAT